MLYRVQEDQIFIASNNGETRFSFPRAEFAHIAHLCGDDASQTLVVTASKEAADLADVMANRRGKYRAYRMTDGGPVQLTNEYTNTATPLPGG